MFLYVFSQNYQIKFYTALILPYVKPLIFPDAQAHKFEYHSAYQSYASVFKKNSIS